jgi:hypothetical protein
MWIQPPSDYPIAIAADAQRWPRESTSIIGCPKFHGLFWIFLWCWPALPQYLVAEAQGSILLGLNLQVHCRLRNLLHRSIGMDQAWVF